MRLYNFLGNLGAFILILLNIISVFFSDVDRGGGPDAEFYYYVFNIIFGILCFLLVLAYFNRNYREDSMKTILSFSIFNILFYIIFYRFVLYQLCSSLIIFLIPICLINIPSVAEFIIAKNED